MNTRRVKLFAAKLRDELHEQWNREQQENQRREAQQADLMRWALNAGAPKNIQQHNKTP